MAERSAIAAASQFGVLALFVACMAASSVPTSKKAAVFQGVSVLSVVADAVHVGSDWLKVVAYAPEKDSGHYLSQS